MSRTRHTIVPWAAALAVVLLACLATGERTAAEAVPSRANPPMEQAVPVMPRTVEIWFSEAVNPTGTAIQVRKSDGTQVDMENSTVDPQDSTGTRVSVDVHSGMDNGVYFVEWAAVSAVDGTSSSGAYTFTVDPAASPQPLPQIATQQAPAQLPEIDANGDPVDTERNPLLYGIVAAITALALIGLLLFWYFRRAAHGRRWSDRPVDRL